MDLAAGVITANENSEFYGCPMLIHSHIREEKSGTCTDCGMNLNPCAWLNRFNLIINPSDIVLYDYSLNV